MKYLSLCGVVLFLTAVSPASAQSTSSHPVEDYLHYLDTYPETLGPWGNASLGEIEIIRDRNTIAEIEQRAGRKVGVISQDNYWIWLNDAVKFPNGKYGVYGRMLWTHSLKGVAGVAVVPLLPNGKIALNRNFRHATRSWEYELPRGGRAAGESVEAAAVRELREETGMGIDALFSLGEMAVDTGLTNSVIPIFLGKVISQEEAQPEDSEAIAAIEAFSIEELKKGFVDGYLTALVDGKPCKINLRDPFLAFALLQAESRALFAKTEIKHP
jgi:ADP-ribose pyrophosphatase